MELLEIYIFGSIAVIFLFFYFLSKAIRKIKVHRQITNGIKPFLEEIGQPFKEEETNNKSVFYSTHFLYRNQKVHLAAEEKYFNRHHYHNVTLRLKTGQNTVKITIWKTLFNYFRRNTRFKISNFNKKSVNVMIPYKGKAQSESFLQQERLANSIITHQLLNKFSTLPFGTQFTTGENNIKITFHNTFASGKDLRTALEILADFADIEQPETKDLTLESEEQIELKALKQIISAFQKTSIQELPKFTPKLREKAEEYISSLNTLKQKEQIRLHISMPLNPRVIKKNDTYEIYGNYEVYFSSLDNQKLPEQFNSIPDEEEHKFILTIDPITKEITEYQEDIWGEK